MDSSNSKLSKMIRYRVSISDADEKLREICITAAEAKYSYPLPSVVHERLEKELSSIESSGHANQYLIGAMLAEQSEKEGYPVSTRGMVGSALVSHLCGITAVNPLPAHYWCPSCHHFELHDDRNKKTMGYDLSDKACPHCGMVMNAEGADIEPEILMGSSLDREPDIILNVAAEVRPKLIAFLMDAFGENRVFRAGVKAVLDNGVIKEGVHPGGIFILPEDLDIHEVTELRPEIPDDDFGLLVTDRDYHELDGILKKYDLLTLSELSMLAELKQRTGVSAGQIKTNDQDILDMIRQKGFSFLAGRNVTGNDKDFESTLIRELKPGCFSEIVRITGMMHGVQTWKNNAELLLRSGHKLADCISTRDDIMQELISVGKDRERAYEIMNYVRKGYGLTEEMEQEMASVGMPDWFIESCDKIVYLFPKAHVTEYALIYWELAYYRLHFPEEYAKVLASPQRNAESVS